MDLFQLRKVVIFAILALAITKVVNAMICAFYEDYIEAVEQVLISGIYYGVYCYFNSTKVN